MRREQQKYTYRVWGEFGPGSDVTGTYTVVYAEGAEDHAVLVRLVEAALSQINICLTQLSKEMDRLDVELANTYKMQLRQYCERLTAYQMLPWYRQLFVAVPVEPVAEFADRTPVAKMSSSRIQAEQLLQILTKFNEVPGALMYEDHNGLIDHLTNIAWSETAVK